LEQGRVFFLFFDFGLAEPENRMVFSFFFFFF